MAPQWSTPCVLCIKVAKWLPVIFIVCVVVWSYYAYVIQLNLLTINSILEKCLYLFFYHILLTLFLWAYWQTIFTEIGHVPKQFRLPLTELDQYESAESDENRKGVLENFAYKNNLPVTNRTMTGDIRYCDKCCHIKPDRCHHCSVCGECVLKMDHHCPWVNNCVAFTNYKFFVLFLGYALLYCLFIAFTTLQYFIMFWKANNNDSPGLGKFHILFVFFVSIMFALSLVSLFGYHCFLISKNRSTLESFRAPIFRIAQTIVQDKEGFSLGSYNNFLEIFGDNKKYWFLPIYTSVGDGVVYPLRHNQHPSSHTHPVQTYGSTINSNGEVMRNEQDPINLPAMGDGMTYPQQCVDECTDGLLSERQRWSDEENELSTGFVNTAKNYDLETVTVLSNHTNPV